MTYYENTLNHTQIIQFMFYVYVPYTFVYFFDPDGNRNAQGARQTHPITHSIPSAPVIH